MSTASITCSDTLVDIKEFRELYEAKAQKKDHDITYQIPHLAKLADAHHQHALKHVQYQNSWRYFVQAQGLYNSCKARAKTEKESLQWQQKVTAVERDYMQHSGYSENQISNFLLLTPPDTALRQLRDHLRAKLVCLECLESDYDLSTLENDKNKDIETQLINQVKSISGASTTGMKGIIKQLIEDVQCSIGQPPCGYTVVGCGSLAREEMTPYSDLEFFILHETVPNVTAYFIRLAVLVYFHIARLGETNIHYLNIQELDGWFVDDGPSGLRFDGLSPIAGNIPTGNGLSTGKLLINSPRELTALYKSELLSTSTTEATKGINGNLSDLLATTVLICSYNLDLDLYQEFVNQKSEIDRELLSQDSMCYHNKIELLHRDIEKHNFLPVYNVYLSGEAVHQVKRAIYRFPTILLNDLKTVYGKSDLKTPWEVIDTLEQERVLKPLISHMLHLLVAIAMHTRFATYLALNGQKENLCFLKFKLPNSDSSDRFFMSQKWYIAMTSILVPMKTKLQQSIEMMVNSESVSRIFQDLCIDRDDRVTLCLAYYYQGDRKSSYDLCQTLVNSQSLRDSYDNLSSRYSSATANLLIKIYGNSARYLHKYEEAVSCGKFFMQLADETDPDNPDAYKLLANLGTLLYFQGHYDESLMMLQSSLEIYKRVPDSNKVEQSRLLNNIARVQVIVGNKQEALHNYEKCLEVYQQTYGNKPVDTAVLTRFNLANCHYELGNVKLALNIHRQALEGWKELYGLCAIHRRIASSLDSIGNILLHTGDPANRDEALNHLTKALEMRQVLVGENSTDTETSTSLAYSHEHLGEYYIETKQSTKAFSHLKQALQVRQRVFKETQIHMDLAMTYRLIARAYMADDNYEAAQAEIEKAIQSLPDGRCDGNKVQQIKDTQAECKAAAEKLLKTTRSG